MKMPLYTVWGDPFFYAYAAGFAASMFALIYSISRWVELKNEARYHEELPLPPLPADLAAAADRDAQAWEQALAGDDATAPGVSGYAADTAPEQAAAGFAPEEAAVDADKTVVVPNIEELVAQSAQAATAGIPGEELPAEEAAAPVSAIEFPHEESAPAAEAAAINLPAAEPAAPAPAGAGPAGYVRGIYERLAGMEARLSAIEGSVSHGEDSHFAVKFIEGMLEDFDTLSKDKIKARVNYLIADLKESQQRASR